MSEHTEASKPVPNPPAPSRDRSIYDEFQDSNHATVTIRESSDAQPHVWLSALGGTQPTSRRMHLSADKARRVRDALNVFLYERAGDGERAAKLPQISRNMACRAARLLLTEVGELPPVHAAIGTPERPLCNHPDAPGPGGYSNQTLRITCRGCMDVFGFSEDRLAEYDRWTREGIPPEQLSMSREEVLAMVEERRGR